MRDERQADPRDATYECPCGQEFESYSSEYVVHMLRHHPEEYERTER
jgi:hypothetical protein